MSSNWPYDPLPKHSKEEDDVDARRGWNIDHGDVQDKEKEEEDGDQKK
jgi:hypothetical protein